MNRVCVICGSNFEAKTERAKYCSEYCKNRSRFKRSIDDVRAENEKLKLELLKWYKKGLKDKEIASKIGRSVTWAQKTRIDMGLPRQGYKKAREKENHKQELAQMEVRFCKKCGSYFYPIRVNQIFCSKACEKSMNHQVNDIVRKRLVEKAKVDKIPLDAVYKKYNGICYLCGGQCDYQAVKIVNGIPKALGDYPSREHVIPLSKGGLHSWENVRLAHIKCNSSKGVRYG